MSKALWETEITAAGRAGTAAQQLAADNPDGFTGEQQAEWKKLVEAFDFHNDRAESLKRVAALAERDDKDAEIRQDLDGLGATGEAKIVKEDTRSKLVQMSRGQGTSDIGIDLNQSQWMQYSRHLAEGGNAREWVEQTLSFTATEGGNTVPTRIATSFFENLYRVNGLRKAGANVISMDEGAPIELPKTTEAAIAFDRNTTNVSSLQVAVSGQAVESDPSTSVVELTPKKYMDYTRVPRELIQDSATDIEMMVGEQLGRSIARKTEIAYAQGRGTNGEPDGWNRTTVVGNTDYSGAGNARRIITDGSNVIAYMDLHNLIYAVDDYGNWQDMSVIMHKGTVGEIFGLTGTDGHPIFRYTPYYGGADNARDGMGMLLGYPVHLATYCGRSATDNDVLAMFGPIDDYTIRDVNSVEIRRWDQARYLTNEVDFTALIRTDGKFINPTNLSWLVAKA